MVQGRPCELLLIVNYSPSWGEGASVGFERWAGLFTAKANLIDIELRLLEFHFCWELPWAALGSFGKDRRLDCYLLSHYTQNIKAIHVSDGQLDSAVLAFVFQMSSKDVQVAAVLSPPTFTAWWVKEKKDFREKDSKIWVWDHLGLGPLFLQPPQFLQCR